MIKHTIFVCLIVFILVWPNYRHLIHSFDILKISIMTIDAPVINELIVCITLVFLVAAVKIKSERYFKVEISE